MPRPRKYLDELALLEANPDHWITLSTQAGPADVLRRRAAVRRAGLPVQYRRDGLTLEGRYSTMPLPTRRRGAAAHYAAERAMLRDQPGWHWLDHDGATLRSALSARYTAARRAGEPEFSFRVRGGRLQGCYDPGKLL